MIGYALFLIPMLLLFVWISIKHGITQALLDLLALSLFFNFEFAAILPGNLNLLLIHVLLIALLFDWLLRMTVTGDIRIVRRGILIIATVFLLVVWLVVVDGLRHYGDFGTRQLINYLLMSHVVNPLFFIVGIRLAKRQRLERFVKILLIASALVGIISVVQMASDGKFLTDYSTNRYLGVFEPLSSEAVQRRDLFDESVGFLAVVKTLRFGDFTFYRAPGTFDGSYTVQCAVALALFSLLIRRTQRISFWLFIPLILSIAGFVSAFNRTAIATFALVAGALAIVRWRHLFSMRLLLHWAMAVLLLATLAFVFRGPIGRVGAAVYDGFFGNKAGAEVQSLNGRTRLWAYVLTEIKNHPWFGSDAPITMYRAGWGDNDDPRVYIGTHNSFLEFTYRGGIVAGVLFLSLFTFCLLRLYQLAYSKQFSQQQRNFYAALLVGAVGMFLLQQTGNWMILPQIAALFWIFCGYLATYTPTLAANALQDPNPAGIKRWRGVYSV